MSSSHLHRLLLPAALVAPAVLAAAEAQPQHAAGVRNLISRYAPGLADGFVLETIPAVEGRDAFEIESSGNKVVLRGSDGVALASAFHRYLNDFCHAQISWNGENLKLPASLPLVSGKIRVVAPLKHRFAYNYCTHGYTMAFWDEAAWAREIDRLALHGVNLALIIEGQDAVWQNTFARFGYTKDEMRRWLCSPAHQPWQFMGNMAGFMPPSQAIIDRRAKLGKFIAERCRALGVRLVLQGYYGMLPDDFAKKHPGAKIHPQGGWAGGNKRPDMLDPGDPLFPEVALAFMEEQKKIFGDCEFFAADPFHEGGSSKGMDRGVVYKQIQDAILAFEPKATLVKQCWGASNKDMFDAGDKERSLALDLWCDVRPFWRKANGYDGTPWLWCMISNFGGNLALEADLPALARDFAATLKDPARKRLEGAAIVPEGSRTNPLVYELMTDMARRGAPADLGVWLNATLAARYGARNTDAESAWASILETAYSTGQDQGPINSVITARPSLNRNLRGRTWAPGSRVPYENRDLLAAWQKLLAAAPALGDRDTYRHDLADVSQQVLVNLARPVYEKAADAIDAKDVSALKRHAERYLALLADIDELAGTRRDRLMGAWVADARKLASTDADRAYMDKVARTLLTTWMRDPDTNLADYANREWNGLVAQYYAPRWKLFFDCAAADIAAGKAFDTKAYGKQRAAQELAWIDSGRNTMLTEPKGDTVAVARKLLEKYAPVVAEYAVPGRMKITAAEVVGVWKFKAQGRDLLRELRDDGTVQAYDDKGAKLNWFDGFRWAVKNDRVTLTRGDLTVVLERRRPDTLDFVSEGFGEAVKTTVPGTQP